MEIELSLSLIRSWRESDRESLVAYANNRKVWRNLRDSFPHPYTLTDADGWIAYARAAQPETNFALDVGGEAVGGIGLALKGDVYRRTAEIGYWLGEPFWGRGIATEAVKALTGYAFTTFDLSRIHAGVYEWNHGSMRVLEKAGYVREARLRKSIFKEGRIIDEIIFAVIRE
ncbi:MAG TPA: GNAT family N-acetyltransferase [Blastocatellia bacterium]|nr:GNAT family N-acetyltransferase [Blastocatellia bacterium]